MNKLLKRILKNNIVLVSSSTFEKLIFLFLTIYLARKLGVSEYGKWGFILSFTSLFTILTDLGLNTLFIRETSKNKINFKFYFSNIFFLKFILSILTLILVIVLSNLLKINFDIKISIYLITFSFIFTTISSFFNSIYISYQKMEFNSLFKVLNTILLAVFYILALKLGYGVIGLALSTLFVSLILMICNLIMIKKSFLKKLTYKVDNNSFLRLIKNALPFGLTVVFSIIYFKIDIIMLSVMLKDDFVLGLYNAATKLIVNALFIPIIFSQTIFPVMSYYYKSHKLKSILKNSYKFILLISLITSLVIFLFSKQIILIVYGKEFIQASTALSILSIFYVFASLNMIQKTYLNSINMQKTVTYVIFFGAILNILLNLYFIPRYSFIGASITTVISEVITLIILYIYTKKYKLKDENRFAIIQD